MARNQFATKIGLITATVGSAVGLGNVWRFPAETQANGGAAFLLLYILCVIVLGIPVMLAEMSLGRSGRSDAVGVFNRISPGSSWWIIGATAVIASYLITCFYMVVEGWTFEYLFQSVTGNLYTPLADATSTEDLFTTRMDEYISSDIAPIIFTWGAILLNAGILLGGVSKGIERLSNVLMPLLFVVLLVLCAVSLSLPDAMTGIKWFLSPDFSKITPSTVVSAMGQTFFSMSLGMGILVTYSSYYPKSTNLSRTAGIVAIMSLIVAVLTGLVIFPAVSHFGLADHSLTGATLVFRTLPEVFACLPYTRLWSVLFFILLAVAALTSTVSLMEVTVAFLHDRFNFSRKKALTIIVSPMFILSALCSLSFGSLSDFHIFGMTLFGFLDNFATNILLPLVSIGTCIYLGWYAPKQIIRDQLTNFGQLSGSMSPIVVSVIRYLAPAMIAVILISNFI